MDSRPTPVSSTSDARNASLISGQHLDRCGPPTPSLRPYLYTPEATQKTRPRRPYLSEAFGLGQRTEIKVSATLNVIKRDAISVIFSIYAATSDKNVTIHRVYMSQQFVGTLFLVLMRSLDRNRHDSDV